MVEIKVAQEQDLPVVQALIQKIWKPTYQNILSEDQMDYMLETMFNLQTLAEQLQQGHRFLILYFANDPLGFAAFEWNYDQTKQTKLHKIYLLPGHQGKGLGNELLATVIQEARAKEQTHLVLNVNRSNKAFDFYKRLGFVVTETVDLPIGNGYFMNDYVMSLDL